MLNLSIEYKQFKISNIHLKDKCAIYQAEKGSEENNV